jgi:hypothetical protein
MRALSRGALRESPLPRTPATGAPAAQREPPSVIGLGIFSMCTEIILGKAQACLTCLTASSGVDLQKPIANSR